MAQTLGIVKDNKFRQAMRQKLKDAGLEPPTPSQAYDLALMSAIRYSDQLAKLDSDPELFTIVEFYNKR